MLTFTMQQGEYKRIYMDYLGSEFPWDDLTGCSVSMAIKSDDSAVVTVAGSLGQPNSDGKITQFGADVPLNTAAGVYDVALTISKAGTIGFPQVEPCQLIISDHP